ncbi:MAG: hypothetical protein ACXV7J_04705 [Methylomonas sp.]
MKLLSTKLPLSSQPHSHPEPVFPSARYFQIHFDHLHETIDELRRQVDQANQQIAELQQHLHIKPALLDADVDDYAGKDEIPSGLD